MLKNLSKKSEEVVTRDLSIHAAAIRTLLYFDIFHYPLRQDEILHFLEVKSSADEVAECLRFLTDQKYIYQLNEFYSIQNRKENVVRRLKGNEMARSFLPRAVSRASLIGRFPFVRAVMASGSLSKNYMDSESDLDFFIVTEPGRLWIARMLLVLFKRVFLMNSHKHFCVNYFVTTESLEIAEKNQFTATELATVIPLYNQPLYRDLLQANQWLEHFYPNFVPRATNREKEKTTPIKRWVEQFIDIMGGNKLDDWCMRRTQQRWIKLYKKQYSPRDFEIAFKTAKQTSKNHPRHYQKKITDRLEEKWRTYCEEHNFALI